MNSFGKIFGYVADSFTNPFTKAIGAFIVMFTTWCFPGGFFVTIHILLGLVFFDVVSGICASYTLGRPITSKSLLEKVKRLFGFMVVLISAGMTEKAIDFVGNSISWFCACYFIVHEFYSILENISKCGVPVPSGLLRMIKGRIEKMNNNELINDKKN